MMRTAKVVLIFSLAFLFFALGLVMLQTRLTVAELGGVASGAHDAVLQLQTTIAKANMALDSVNDPDPRRGTIRLINKDLSDVGDLVKRADHTDDIEQASLKQWNGQLTEVLNETTTLIHTANETSSAATGTLASMTSRIDGLAPIENNAAKVLSDADHVVADPNVDALLFHVAGMSISLDKMLETGNQVETKATQNYLHPSSNAFVRTWKSTSPFFLPVAQVIGAAAQTYAAGK